MQAFGGGVILTLGFVHLLSDAVDDLGQLRSFPIATSLCLAGVLCMFFLEQAAALYFHQHHEEPHPSAVKDAHGSLQPSEGTIAEVCSSAFHVVVFQHFNLICAACR